MLRNIAKKKVYGWSLWKRIENTRIAIGTMQMERWHLRDMHMGHKVSYLTRWLASHIAAKTRNGNVTVRSTWIDHYPQAHTYYQPAGSTVKKSVSVELADLLLVVKVQNSGGLSLSERAVLLQAKCSNLPQILDASHAGSSTDDERNLLEACCAPICVTSGAGSSSTPINSKRSAYDLGASVLNPGLGIYARYLLIPRKFFSRSLPYMTVWPASLTARTGSPAHFSDILLAMTGVGAPGAFAGSAVNTSIATTGWDHLVKDLTNYCNNQPWLNRFASKTGLPFPRDIQRSYNIRNFHPFSAIFSSFLRKVFEGSWFEKTLCLKMMPDEGGKVPPWGREDKFQEAPNGGFTLLQVTITIPHSLS